MTARCVACDCGRWLGGIADSNSAVGMSVFYEFFVLSGSGLVQKIPTNS